MTSIQSQSFTVAESVGARPLSSQPPSSSGVGGVPGHQMAREPTHWTHHVQETLLSTGREGLLHVVVRGGADGGSFCWIADVDQDRVNYHSGRLGPDEVVLEVQGQKVAGYTLQDLLDWLWMVSDNGNPVMFKTVHSGEDLSHLYILHSTVRINLFFC